MKPNCGAVGSIYAVRGGGKPPRQIVRRDLGQLSRRWDHPGRIVVFNVEGAFERCRLSETPMARALMPFRGSCLSASPPRARCSLWIDRSEEHTSELQSLRHL